MGRGGRGAVSLKIQRLPGDTFKFWAHDGLSPALRARLGAPRLGAPCPGPDSPRVLDPPLPPRPGGQPLAPLLGLLMYVGAPRRAAGREDRRQGREGSAHSPFLGSASFTARPGRRALPSGAPARGVSGGKGQARGAEGTQSCSKWQRQKPTTSLTYPGSPGQLRAGDRALGRHKGSMEKLFPSPPAAGRGDSSAAPRGPAPAPGSQPPRVPGREPFPRVSKKCQVRLAPHPAGEASRLPRRPAPLCVAAAARRAPPRGVQPEAVRGSGRPDW